MAKLSRLALPLLLPVVALSVSGAPTVGKTGTHPGSANMRYQARNYRTLYNSEKITRVNELNEKLSGHAKKGMGKANLKPDFSLLSTDQYEYLDGPGGSVYFCTSEFETEDVVISEYYTKKDIRSYKFTIYDENLNRVGDIKGKITLDSISDSSNPENGVASVGLTPLVTKRFFNSDDKLEVMVYLNINTDNYTVHSRSEAYQIGGQKDEEGYDVPLCTINGNLCDVLETSTSSWSEDFYLSFATDCVLDTELGEDATFGDYLNSLGIYIETFKKVSYASKLPEKVFEYTMRLNDYPGDQESATPFLSLNIGGKPYFVINGYTDGLWRFEGEDEMGFPEQIWNDETDYFIEVYQPNSLEDPNLLQRTVIDMQKSEGSNIYATFYYLGDLSYRGDVDYKYCDEQGKANFVLTTRDWDGAEMGTTANYYLYAPDGSIKSVLGKNIDGVLGMSDLDGQEPEYMFVTNNGDAYTFSFLCPYTGNQHHSFRQMLRYNGRYEGLYVNGDRVADGDSYKYCFELNTPGVDDNGNDMMRVAWINTDGEIIEVDEVNMGTNVAMAKVYIDSHLLNPYVFDNTPEREYMIILKRGDEYSSLTQEEFIVGTATSKVRPDGVTLLHIVPDDQLGNLMNISALEAGDNTMLWVVYYNYDTSKFSQEFYNMPFMKFDGGDGTEANPYRITSIGDLQSVRDDLSAHYELVKDIDAEGYDFSSLTTSSKPFTGSLKGNGHVIRNLTVSSSANASNNAIFGYTDNAVISGLTLLNPTVKVTGSTYNALIAAHAQRSTFSDIHVYGVKADYQSEGGFGTIVNQATLNTVITGCSVANASINAANGVNVGGIAAETRTGSTIAACSFAGSLTGRSVVGGILGTSGPNSGGVTDCHTDADIAAANIVGGIVGDIDTRVTIDRCYVEGSVSASEVFGTRIVKKGYAAGGVAGMVSTHYDNTDGEGEEDVQVVISNCLVNLESISTPELPQGHQSSVHRIAGFTSVNDLQPDWDNITDYNNIDKFLPTVAEAGLKNNYAVSTLTAVDGGIEAGDTTTEGKDIDASALDGYFFAALGYGFGDSAEKPWNEVPENDPSLYHEVATTFAGQEITAVEETDFDVELIVVSRTPMTPEEFIDGFACEISDESVVEMTGAFSMSNNVAKIGFYARKLGETELTANVNGNLALVKIKVIDAESAGIEDVTADEGGVVINFDGTTVSAPGALEVYTISGVKVAAGIDSVSLESLSGGLYIVVASDNAGHRTARKFILQ